MKRFAWISQTVSEKSSLRQLNVFTEEEIGYAVRIRFSWTHFCFDRLPENNLLNKTDREDKAN